MDENKNIVKKIEIFKKTIESLPELGWQEYKTYKYIVSQLGNSFIWSEKTALIYAVGSGKEVLFRAELDGLNTTVGVKHVCGHAAHMAALMGAYLYFKKFPPVGYKIYFVFQPCEEGYPSGAQFISEKFSPLQHCLASFAFHAFPSPKANILYNPVFASCDYFKITIHGRGTHIKNKNNLKNKDVLLVASALIKTINTRRFKNSLINIGIVKGGETANSIAGLVTLEGDIRALSEPARKETYEWLKKQLSKWEKEKTIKISLFYNTSYPLLTNDRKLLAKVGEIISVKDTIISFATEDFSLYPTPKVFLLIGTGKEKDLHEVDFSVSIAVTKQIFRYWQTIGNNLKLIVGE